MPGGGQDPDSDDDDEEAAAAPPPPVRLGFACCVPAGRHGSDVFQRRAARRLPWAPRCLLPFCALRYDSSARCAGRQRSAEKARDIQETYPRVRSGQGHPAAEAPTCGPLEHSRRAHYLRLHRTAQRTPQHAGPYRGLPRPSWRLATARQRPSGRATALVRRWKLSLWLCRCLAIAIAVSLSSCLCRCFTAPLCF
jgi:hypothetical protein